MEIIDVLGLTEKRMGQKFAGRIKKDGSHGRTKDHATKANHGEEHEPGIHGQGTSAYRADVRSKNEMKEGVANLEGSHLDQDEQLDYLDRQADYDREGLREFERLRREGGSGETVILGDKSDLEMLLENTKEEIEEIEEEEKRQREFYGDFTGGIGSRPRRGKHRHEY